MIKFIVKLFVTIMFLSISFIAMSENVVIYIVDRDDYDFSRVKRTVATKEEAETDYNTLILVYDSYQKKCIGGVGTYEYGEPTKTEFKQIVKESVLEMYKGNTSIRGKGQKRIQNNDPFDNILGLRWGMKLDVAIEELKKMGLHSYVQSDDTAFDFIKKVSWEGVVYDNVRLEYMISNKQNKYLSGVGFLKFCNSAKEAKELRESIAIMLKLTYGEDAVKDKIGENKFKKYSVYKKYSWGSTNCINLYISKAYNFYGVVLSYNGYMEACDYVNMDNESF